LDLLGQNNAHAGFNAIRPKSSAAPDRPATVGDSGVIAALLAISRRSA
jgi:hypothetical protein